MQFNLTINGIDKGNTQQYIDKNNEIDNILRYLY